MKYVFENGNVRILKDLNFDIGRTFECGQCFRFEKCPEGYEGVAFGRLLKIHVENGDTIIDNMSETEFSSRFEGFFDLHTDYGSIIEKLSSDSIFKSTVEISRGIHILNQDPWETVCSFIISANNNIPRIKKIIGALCDLYGEKAEGTELKAFPTAKAVSDAGISGLEPIRSGFRAKYIIDAAQKFYSGEINPDELRLMSYADAKKCLMKINGVGPKVADCVLLFSLGFGNAFPKDVWINRIIDKYYGKDFDENIFGTNAGIAQQFLYYYERSISVIQ